MKMLYTCRKIIGGFYFQEFPSSIPSSIAEISRPRKFVSSLWNIEATEFSQRLLKELLKQLLYPKIAIKSSLFEIYVSTSFSILLLDQYS